MNFDLSEEQGMLRDNIARYIQEEYDFAARNQVLAGADGFSREHWQTFAKLGWLSIPFAEEHGGLGGSAVDTMLIMEQLGRGLVLEPYLATVLLFGGLVQAAGSGTQQEALLPGLISGELQGAFAWLERQSRFDLNAVSTRATSAADGYVIDGEKTVVFNGLAAEQLLVSARNSDAADDISLFLVAPTADGVTRTGYRLMDGQQVATIRFDQVAVPATALCGERGRAAAVIAAVVDAASLALCAEAVGIMARLNEITIEFARTREQFGAPIGSFQALQHRMVDTFMAYEQVKSLLYRAVCATLEDSADAPRSLHALKTLVARAGQRIGGEAIQIHGGMGLTEELSVGHYVRRLMMINTTFGNGDYHQQRFNALSYGRAGAA